MTTGTHNEHINGWEVQTFDGPVISTYAVYDDRGRCRGTYDTYGEAVAHCWGLAVADIGKVA